MVMQLLSAALYSVRGDSNGSLTAERSNGLACACNQKAARRPAARFYFPTIIQEMTPPVIFN
jgi:hypothetical protein